MPTPIRYWITSGTGESDVSILVAMDKAYMNSGLGYQNHVPVSSIPPVTRISPQINKDQGVTYVPVNNDLQLLPFSEVVHVVRAVKTGETNNLLCCSISLAKINAQIDGEEHLCLLAFESTGNDLKNTESESLAGVIEMVQERNAVVDVSWGNDGYESYSISLEVKQKYGCAVVFVVFDPFTYKYDH